MSQTPAARRWLALGVTVAIFGSVVAAIAYQKPTPKEVAEKVKDEGEKPKKAEDPKPKEEVAKPKEAEKPVGRAATEWPLFGGTLTRNLVNLTDKNVPTTWSVEAGKEMNIKWSANLGSKAYGGPIISGGKIFVGTNNGQPRDPKYQGDKGVLMCFEEKTGKFLWQSVYDKLAAGRVQDWPEEGICSSPFVEGDLLYYVNNRCEVICAKVADGSVVWKLDMIGKLGVFPHNLATCSPLAVGDTLFIITSNGVDEGHINIPKPEAPSFLALEKKTGKVKWSSDLPSINLVAERKARPNVTVKELVDKGQVLMHGQWSNPVYAEASGKAQIIFPGGDGWIRSYNPANGDLLWKFDCNPKKSIYVLGPKGTRNDFVSTPIVWENKLYIGVGQDPEHLKGVGHLWCIDITKEPKNKDKDLSPVNDNFDPKAPENKDSGLVWHFGGENPTKKPRAYHFGRTMSTCCIHEGLLYASEYDGWVHCLDARTGSKFWDHDMGADNWSSPYWVDGKIYIGNENGEVNIFEHGKTKKHVGTIDFGPGTLVRATPVVCNGVMYVMTENPCKMYAITPGGK